MNISTSTSTTETRDFLLKEVQTDFPVDHDKSRSVENM